MNKKVILFSSTSCPWCLRAKNYLREKGVRVKEIKVDKDPQAAQDLLKMTGRMAVPVLVIGGKKVVGFDRQKIDKLLGLK